ncbi:MAG: threonine/serine dehydratase [Caldilineaceae bacterium]|nr:threonine/serine dehydratase [Caldilineaceae bacterium]MDE0338602.1 threonine/serine dehydratase [Caldilineaceae bacterium]
MAASSSRQQTNGAAKFTGSENGQRHPAGMSAFLADLPDQIRQAASRIRPHIVETPLLLSPTLSKRTGAQVYLKLENRQHTGSFKLRGATNKLLNLTAEERARGVVTASTGNHALAVAHAATLLNINATIFLPEAASPRKVEKLEAFPVALCRTPGDALNAEISARQAAQQLSQPFISPYNDPHIIAGQGTIAVELLRQQPQLAAVFVTVGGGGLMGGVASCLNASHRAIQTFGCQPDNSAVMLASVRAGRIVETESLPTLSDGSAGGIEPHSVTYDLCQNHVDHWLTVSEAEIATAMRLIHRESGECIEGAAGVAVASLLKTGKHFAGQRLAVVICGGNVDSDSWQQVLEQGD